MVRSLDNNDKYAILRFALIAQFADDNFRESYDLEPCHFQEIYSLLKQMYFNFIKYKEID